MEVNVTLGKKRYAVDVKMPQDISIPVRFDGTSLSAFGAEPAHRAAYTAGDFVGDVGKNGSCNCDVLHFSPHLHGTHTECVGHIVSDAVYVCDVIADGFIPSTLITVTPQRQKDDLVITKDAFAQALHGHDPDFLQGLIIRTLPNGTDKMTRHYGTLMPPFFSVEAIQYIGDMGAAHLLVDMPSIDRLEDGGKLANHRIFWGVAPGARTLGGKTASRKTVTELIYVDAAIPDGNYMLNLQVAALKTDAAPSRPIIYKVTAA